MTQIASKRICALYSLTRLPDGSARQLLESSLKGLTEHADIFFKPPVDLKAYKAAIDAYGASMPAARDGSRTAIALKNKLREAAAKMYVELAHYVEANCNEDMATFLLSGFQAAPTTKTPPQPLDQPTIAHLAEGPVSGQLKVKVRTVPKASSYELRWAPVPSDGAAPPSWIQETMASTKPKIIDNLTLGTLYMFQVRGVGVLGYTNWSDPVSRRAV